MKAPLKLIVFTATAALLSGVTFAQDQQQRQDQQQSPSSSSASQSSGGSQELQRSQFFRASDVLNKSAKTANGQDLGKVKDITFNQSGQIFALIDLGNNRYAAAPWQLINTTASLGSKDLVVNTTKQALSSGPTVTKDNWGTLNNPAFVQQIYAHFNVQQQGGTAMGGAGGGAGGASQGQGQSRQPEQQQTGQKQQQQPSQQQPQEQQQNQQ